MRQHEFDPHARVIWFSVLTVITSITTYLVRVLEYYCSENILTEMIGRHVDVIVSLSCYFLTYLLYGYLYSTLYTICIFFSQARPIQKYILKATLPYDDFIEISCRPSTLSLCDVFVVNGMPCFQLEIITVQSLMGHNIPFGGMRTHK